MIQIHGAGLTIKQLPEQHVDINPNGNETAEITTSNVFTSETMQLYKISRIALSWRSGVTGRSRQIY